MSPRPDLGPKPRLGYAESRIERAAELRTDQAALDRLAADPRAGAYIVGGEVIVAKKAAPVGDPLFTLAEARAFGPAAETVFLGFMDGAPRFVPTMWSCLAGFVEPGESIEDAVHRETREEAGITCGRVTYFASQPWPFPTSLMIGCHAEARSRDIVIDREELEGARWFTRDEAASMLLRKHPEGLTTPPPVAIAHHLIRSWVEKENGDF